MSKRDWTILDFLGLTNKENEMTEFYFGFRMPLVLSSRKPKVIPMNSTRIKYTLSLLYSIHEGLSFLKL